MTAQSLQSVLADYAARFGVLELPTQGIGLTNEVRVMKTLRDALLRGTELTGKELRALRALK